MIEMLGFCGVGLLVDWVKKQYTHEDEPTISCINQDTNLDNDISNSLIIHEQISELNSP
jgi:hypothetical protein